MEWGNFRNWFSGSLKNQELSETRALWNEAERLWQAGPAGQTEYADHIRYLVRPAWEDRDPLPSSKLVIELCVATHDLLLPERFCPIEPDWPAIEADAAVAVRFRALTRKRRAWATDFSHRLELVGRELRQAYAVLLDALPPVCVADGDDLLEVPLIEALADPAAAVQACLWAAYDPESMRLGLFEELRETLATNMLVASGFSPEADVHALQHRLVYPASHKDQTPALLVERYLGQTPFQALLSAPVPFRLPTDNRFEHAHIIGGTGHGKTQLLQRMIHADLVAAKHERRSVVVIDSQGDLINKLTRLAVFDPEEPDSLAARLVLIDPADVEFPAALNLFDAHLDRLRGYAPSDRERVLNGVIELYEGFFGALLGAELTQKQGVIFRYLARLMLAIPGATIHTLMQLMEDGRAFKPQMAALEGSARHFFSTEFFHPSFGATKKQILKRLWGVLATPAFERMFAQKANKLDLFEALNDGKIILVSTAKDLLKTEGSALFGRFFIALLTQAALERSTIPAGERTPTFVYVDEAQEYFDDNVETILTQARKYKIGIALAHQTLDQLSPRLRAAIFANTSLKCVGGVSAKDARALADELHTTSDFIESMKRRQGRTEFAVWVKHETPRALRMSVPLGFLEREAILTEEAYAALIAENRDRYCGTLADVLPFDLPEPLSDPVPDKPRPALPEPDPPAVKAVPPPPPRPAEGAGKGGSQHRYVQQMIKGLAEAKGFRAVIEEAVAGGQVDVGLHRDGLSVACEISITSTAAYEARNLAKCLAGRFTHVFAVAANTKRLASIRTAAASALSEADLARVVFLTPDLLPDALEALAAPPPEETLVRGYRVKVSRTNVGLDDARDRQAAVARMIAKSLTGLPKDG